MKFNIILTVPVVMLLAACGGGSSAISNNPTANYSTVKVFSDDAGVARVVSTDGVQGYVIVPDVASVVSTANSLTAEDLANVQVSDFPVVQVLNSNANLRQGAMTVEGQVANVTAIEDLGGEAAAFFIEFPGYANALIVSGTQPVSIPTGAYQYQGTLGTGVRNVNNAQPEFGAFTLDANFAAQSFNINGSTLSDTLSGSGVINNSIGTINSNNLALTTSGENRSATLYGQFHGNAASSVSGVFHSNENTPVYAGFIVGSR